MKKDFLNEGKAEEVRTKIKEQTITKKTVKSLGFTDKLIKELLPEPRLVPNPHYKSAPEMQLWKRSDVENAMKNPAFQGAPEKKEARREAAKKAADTKRANLKAEIDKFIESINIERMDYGALREAAIKDKQDRYNYYDCKCLSEYHRDAYGADEDTIKRWMVNYVRHKKTDYDEQLYDMKGRTGKNELYYELRNLILDRIAEVYPELAQECASQKKYAVEEP